LRQLAVPRHRFKPETKAILTELVGRLIGTRGEGAKNVTARKFA
jgi:hypothetical protein